MKLTLEHFLELIDLLPKNTKYDYVISGDNKIQLDGVDFTNKMVLATLVTKDGASQSANITTEVLLSFVRKVKENTPLHIESVWNGSGNKRSAWEGLFAHTSEFYIYKANRKKYLVWIPTKEHLIGKVEISAEEMRDLCPQGIITDKYEPYLTAIRTKPFLILGGFSGTGKSQKVKELAYLTCPKELQEEKAPGNYALISVKPNWHDSTELLGYESTISKKYMVTDFMRFLVKAMHYEDEKVPFFCCMDEMNLAHVEEYFAEFLSVLESRKKDENGKIVSAPLVSANVFAQDYQNDGWNIFMDLGFALTKEMKADEVNAILDDPSRKNEAEGLFVRQDLIDELKEKGLCIPSNLIVIGTVNMDDTTNSFSRKVIDRAMIFETDIERFDKDTYFGAEDALTYGNVDGEAFICDEVRADQAVGTPDFDLSEEERTEIIEFINELNDAMAGTSFQVSYRVLNETILYYRAMKIVNGEKASLAQVKNDILMMKVLPRIEGDTAARKALEGLKSYLEDGKKIPDEWTNIKSDMKASEIAALPTTPWKDSLLKISYMLNLLNTGDGFTRFWK